MSTYYQLVCDKCKERVDSCRRGGTISPMAGVSGNDLIWHFLYTHSHHPLRNLSEFDEDHLDYKEWHFGNMESLSSALNRKEDPNAE
jgi:hypothetical protein